MCAFDPNFEIRSPHRNALAPEEGHKEWMNGLVDTFVARYEGTF